MNSEKFFALACWYNNKENVVFESVRYAFYGSLIMILLVGLISLEYHIVFHNIFSLFIKDALPIFILVIVKLFSIFYYYLI